MRCLSIIAALALAGTAFAAAQPAKILKVLPQYVDEKGRTSISPSLFDRDAYQAELRDNPKRRSGMRFHVHWKSRDKTPLTLRIDARGASSRSQVITIERAVEPGRFSRWTSVPLTGETYTRLGDLIAWRVTLARGTNIVAEQKSFLW